MLVFPTRLFAPASMRPPRLVGGVLTGGVSQGGVGQFAVTSGGGFWRIEFDEINLWARNKQLTWRALEAALDCGANPIIVPLADRRHAPVTSPPTSLAFSDDTLWDDETSWTASEITATLTEGAALRATQIAISYAGPLPLMGGEYFSILHAGYGWRMYNAIRVTDAGGGEFLIALRPPLRAAADIGTPINFESPRCVCRLEGEPGAVLEMLRFGKGGPIVFLETLHNNLTS